MKKTLIALLLALCLVLPCAIAEEAAAPKLLAWYTFDDAANLGADASGNANDLVRTINPDGIQAVEGHVGGAVYFGGASGMTCADDANNDIIDASGAKSLTVSFWAKVDLENAHTGNMRVVDEGINGSAEGITNVVKKNVAEDGTVSLTYIAVAGSSDWWGAAATVAEDPAGWHHFVMVYDGDNCSVTTYVDGVKTGECYAEEENLVSGFTFCIGGSWAQWDWFNGGNHDAVAEGFIGAVDEVKVIAGAVHDTAAIDAMK